MHAMAKDEAGVYMQVRTRVGHPAPCLEEGLSLNPVENPASMLGCGAHGTIPLVPSEVP